MSVVSPRNRTVYFRISESEFEKLNRLCRSSDGERSISELARTAVQHMLGNGHGSTTLSSESEPALERFDRHVVELNHKLEQVLNLLRLALVEKVDPAMNTAEDTASKGYSCNEDSVG